VSCEATLVLRQVASRDVGRTVSSGDEDGRLLLTSTALPVFRAACVHGRRRELDDQ
jgi:hypothetical protein